MKQWIIQGLNLPSGPEVHLDLECLAPQYLPKMRKLYLMSMYSVNTSLTKEIGIEKEKNENQALKS